MKKNIADKIQDLQFFGEFGGINPSISDSSSFTYLKAETMESVFDGNVKGCHLYSRHTNPSNKYLSKALSILENSDSAYVTSSGMAAISTCILQVCKQGDEIISNRTIYGGTYALFKNFLPKLGIKVKFVDFNNLKLIEKHLSKKTKVIYCESMSNPLNELVDFSKISILNKQYGTKLIVDNTFTPLIFTPINLGADIVIHSLTKFINGASDGVGGVICGKKEFIDSLKDVNNGSGMLLGPVIDSFRASSILKNLKTLHIRMKQHSFNALYLAENLAKDGHKVFYTGLKNHPHYNLMIKNYNKEFGFGGMMVLDMKNKVNAFKLMEKMQRNNIGYLAVSLGYSKTLFSSPSSSTSSEIPEKEKKILGISDGLVRFSVGIDNDIERTYKKIKNIINKI